MTTYARIAGGQATDVTTTNPWLIFHPNVAVEFYIVPDDTVNGQPMTTDGLTPAPQPDEMHTDAGNGNPPKPPSA